MSWFSTRSRLGLAVTAVLCLCSAPLAAQGTGTIRGRVTDASSQPLPDVQIAVVGTRLGAVTAGNGSYTISNVPVGAHQVIARRLGYGRMTQSVTVASGAEARADFQLQPTASQLDAVVVTGTAGAVEKRTLGNSITQLDVAELTAKTAPQTVEDVLQSKTPGLTLLPGSGTPGAAAEFRIRGAGSLSGYKPVVYIDGVRYNMEALGNFNPTGAGISSQSTQVTSALDMISPSDIESIEVIKGPAAATLYGAEAANGVIQIITKKGSRGQQRAQWNARVDRGAQTWALKDQPNYTTCDAAKLADPATWPGCAGQPVNSLLSGNPLFDDPTALRSGDLAHYALSARGGADRYTYYLAGNHDEEQGVFYNSYNNRTGGRANFGVSPSSNADLQFSAGYTQEHLRLPMSDESANGLTLASARALPGHAAYPGLAAGWRYIDPAHANVYDNETTANRLTFGATANYTPFSWFRNRLTAGLDNTTALAWLISAPGSFDTPEGLSAQRIPRTNIYTLDYVGNVEKAINQAFVSTTSFGSQVVARKDETLFASGVGLGAPDVTVIQSAATLNTSNSFTENNSVGYYGQEQIGWNNRLFVTGAVRVDNNSAFGSDFKRTTYPKGSLSYVASEEPALKGLFDAIHANEFKFRTAFGAAGRAPTPYSATQTYSVSKVSIGTSTGTALVTSAYGNPNLKPERGTEFEVGFDAGFFRDRIGTEFTYYDKDTRDMLVSQAIAPSSGFSSSQWQNLGEVTNKGVELSVYGTPVTARNFAWDTRVNLATNQNRLVSFGTGAKTGSIAGFQAYGTVQYHVVGYPLAGYWDQPAKRDASGNPLVVNGVLQLDTLSYIGSSTPTREMGWSNTFTVFRNWRVYGLLDYKGGFYNFDYRDYNRCRFQNNCWDVNNPQALRPQTAADSALASQLPIIPQSRAHYIEKADFVKLRDLSLSYTLPSTLAQRVGATNADLTLTGHNLALWSNYGGVDPEVNSYGGRLFARADIYTVPMLRSVSLALNLGF